MRLCVMAALAVVLGLSTEPARANAICGEAPVVADPALSHGIAEAMRAFKFSSMSGASFARLAADEYRELTAGRPPDEARSVAVALLHAKCLELMQRHDPARLPWHLKDRLVGLSKLLPDFAEADALLDRIRAAETRR